MIERLSNFVRGTIKNQSQAKVKSALKDEVATSFSDFISNALEQ